MSEPRSGNPVVVTRGWAWVGSGIFAVLFLYVGFSEHDAGVFFFGLALGAFVTLRIVFGSETLAAASTRAAEMTGTVIGTVITVLIPLGLGLTGLYLLVRFIKWAWAD